MHSLLKPRYLLALLAAVVAACVAAWFFLLRQPPDLRELSSIRAQWQVMPHDADDETRDALAERCLDLEARRPGTVGGLSALLLASTHPPDTPAGKQAHRRLADQIQSADVGKLAAAFDRSLGRLGKLEPLAPALLARARNEPDHPRTACLLAAVCSITHPGADAEPPAAYVEAADSIAQTYPDSPDLAHFCEGLGASPAGSPHWAHRFERHLRAILLANQDRKVRCAASFALASVVQSSPDDRQAEAEKLFEEFCSDFDG